jgi:general secretion pathway protein G
MAISLDSRRRKGDEGFTLIELLIVIIILGILAAIVVFGVAKFRDDAKAAACKADVATVNTASQAYYAQKGSYTTVANLVSGGYLQTTPTTTGSIDGTTGVASASC